MKLKLSIFRLSITEIARLKTEGFLINLEGLTNRVEANTIEEINVIPHGFRVTYTDDCPALATEIEVKQINWAKDSKTWNEVLVTGFRNLSRRSNS